MRLHLNRRPRPPPGQPARARPPRGPRTGPTLDLRRGARSRATGRTSRSGKTRASGRGGSSEAGDCCRRSPRTTTSSQPPGVPAPTTPARTPTGLTARPPRSRQTGTPTALAARPVARATLPPTVDASRTRVAPARARVIGVDLVRAKTARRERAGMVETARVPEAAWVREGAGMQESAWAPEMAGGWETVGRQETADGQRGIGLRGTTVGSRETAGSRETDVQRGIGVRGTTAGSSGTGWSGLGCCGGAGRRRRSWSAC